MTVKVLYPAKVGRINGVMSLLISGDHGANVSIPVDRVDELEWSLDKLAGCLGKESSDFFFTGDWVSENVEEIVKETKSELCHFHIEAALRLKKTLGYEGEDFDLLVLLNAAKIRIERHEKRLEELGES